MFVGDESLTQVVAELRRTLENRDVVATVPRVGYRLTVPVTEPARPAPPLVHGAEPSLSDLEAHALCLEAREELVPMWAGCD